MRWWSRVGGVWAELVEWCVVDSEEPCLPGMELPFKSVRYDDRVVYCRKVCGVHLAVVLYWSSTSDMLSVRRGVVVTSVWCILAQRGDPVCVHGSFVVIVRLGRLAMPRRG